ncbi:relaxin receptor 1 isoform X3 [Vespa velutina]|uniref:relaxin receptor 1 isoform X3 n=1 Tax=Vespa velutina TaxID=202808 RepID=UPI001FB3CC06|nr:relaxin receptor 1 isoform X3 [Vespa velutina]
MIYRRVTAISASLILTFFMLFLIMYYFNQNNCPIGTFPCLNSTICKPQSSWCNGVKDCPYEDDESAELCIDLNGDWSWFLKQDKLGKNQDKDCEIVNVPIGCIYNQCHATCKGYKEIPRNLSSGIDQLILTNNSIRSIPANALTRYTQLHLLYLDNNNINEIEEEAFVNQTNLIWLIISDNKLNVIEVGDFAGLINLETLNAKDNQLVAADLSDFENSSAMDLIDFRKNFLNTTNFVLPRLPVLREIMLSENHFESITADMFKGVPALQSLNLEHNHIKTIDENAFKNLKQLLELFRNCRLIGYNPIEDFSMDVLIPLMNLRSLGLQEINMDNLDKDSFNVFNDLDFIYFTKFYYCMIFASKVQKCSPASDGLSSLSHLLSTSMLKGAVWGISCVTFIGNALVLWERFTAKDENRVLSILIRNLAVSDMLMGVYLFIIALVDLQFRDNYNKEASSWMSSWVCIFLGVLAMISSEVSVLILSFMSVERFVLIAAPLKGHHAMRPLTAAASMMFIWITGFILAVIPVILWRNSTRFYGANGMCFPLHIDDPYSIGWQYSAFIFLGVNLLGLITIGYVYAGMFASIWKTRHATPLSVGDMEFALRFFLIVLTDATCWAPIIVLKILAMMKYPVPAELHAWIVVFILPVNSAVNPLLYTFTTPKFRERLLYFNCLNKIRNFVSRKHSSQESQMSVTLSSKNLMFSISSAKKNDPEKIPPSLVIVEDDWNDEIMRHILK